MKYGGKLVHRVKDDYGPIEVVETHGVRSLHFGSAARQSALDLSAPDRIELTYLRSMLAGLLFIPEPSRILLLGLGGGTLARFFSQNYSGSHMVIVELRQAVIDVAKSHFEFAPLPQTLIEVMDANAYLRSMALCPNPPAFEFLAVDIFDGEGPSVLLEDLEFFKRLSGALAYEGVLVINLWCGDVALWRSVLEMLRDVFGGYLGSLSVPGRGNRIFFVQGAGRKRLPRRHLSERARNLENRFGFEFLRMLDRMEFTNPA